MIYRLDEVKRTQLLDKSKTSRKGLQRFNKRKKSKISTQVKNYNKMDMNKLFKQDVFDLSIDVKGETDDYIVRVSFSGFLSELHKIMKPNVKFDISKISKALKNAIDTQDVYVHCSCADFKYRFAYWSTVKNYNSGEPQTSNGKKIRNPNDTLGSGCKHILLVLSNVNWIIRAARTINNYVKFIQRTQPKAYAEIIYPAIYNTKYVEPVQTSIFDTDELDTGVNAINRANELGAKSGQFKQGNKQGVRFAPTNKRNPAQKSIDDEVFK